MYTSYSTNSVGGGESNARSEMTVVMNWWSVVMRAPITMIPAASINPGILTAPLREFSRDYGRKVQAVQTTGLKNGIACRY
jgi:hypothetical protein